MTAADGAGARRVVFVTGMSGAGRTTALKQLEDLGFEAFDNLPLGLVDGLLQAGTEWDRQPLAFAVDVRTRQFDKQTLDRALQSLYERADLAVSVLFID